MFFASLDELSSEPPDGSFGPTVDGSQPSDGGTLDAPGPETRFEGGSIFDVIRSETAFPDVTSNPDVAVPSPCAAGTHELCADFDDGGVSAAWNQAGSQHPAGTLSQSTEHATSSPHSLSVTQMAQSGGAGEIRNCVESNILGNFTRAIVELDVWIDPPAWQSGDRDKGLVVLDMYSDSNRYGTVLFVDQAGTFSSLEGPSPEYHDVPPIPPGAWVHVKLDYKLSGTLDVDIGGAKVQHTFAAATLGNNPRVALAVGLHGFNWPAPAFSVYYDNVVLDLE